VAWGHLVIAGTVVGFAAYIWLLRQVSPTLVATYTFVNPIIAVLLGWLALGEIPTAWTIVGAALVVAAVAGLLIADNGPATCQPALTRQPSRISLGSAVQSARPAMGGNKRR
jgi:drug/metabolite transporter (DMT)-like permease